MRNVTIREIKALYLPEQRRSEKNNLWGYYVLRKVSYYPTWLLLKVGVSSANKVSWSSVAVGLVGCILLALGNYNLMIMGALLINFWALLDYVDGHIARYNNSSSAYGAFTDALCDYVMSISIFVGAGIGVFNYSDFFLDLLRQSSLGLIIDRSIFLFLGVWASLFYIFPRYVSDTFSKIFSREGQGETATSFREDFLHSSLHMKAFHNLLNVTGLVVPTLLIAVVLRSLSVFVCFWAMIHTCAFLGLIILILKRARKG